MTASQHQPRFFERLEGPRIVIRPFDQSDADALFQAAVESRDRLLPWLPWAQGYQSVDEAHDFIARSQDKWQTGEVAGGGVFAREDGHLLGGIGLHPGDWEVPSFEIGYWLRNGAEGHGYMSEAVSVLTAYAARELGANRVQIRCDARNRRSAAVAERQGFVREGMLRNHLRSHSGGLRDTLVFSLTPGDARWPGPQ